jgi:hypothetical protein
LTLDRSRLVERNETPLLRWGEVLVFAEVDANFLHNLDQVVVVHLTHVGLAASAAYRLRTALTFFFVVGNAKLGGSLDDVEQLPER